MPDLHPVFAEMLATFGPAPQKTSRDALAAYHQTLSACQYTRTVNCPQCFADLHSGLIPNAKLRAVYPSLTADQLFCDADCLMDFCLEHIEEIVRHGEPGYLHGSWVEVRA